MLDITTIILTLNEETHIRRCIDNAFKVSKKVYVVDSFSTDSTCEIAREMGAIVIQHSFVNQAQQFQWALENCIIDTGWMLRLDADEYLTDELIDELSSKLPSLPENVTGCYLPRRVFFMGKMLRHGLFRKVRLLRLWRTGSVRMDQQWMDEKCVLTKGSSIQMKNSFVDHNLKGLGDFTTRHNNYSNREAFEVVNKKFNILEVNGTGPFSSRNKKKALYYKLPRFLRAYMYFFVRYFILFGFLDGRRGYIWLKLQAYWYRLLVDSKLYEMEKKLGKNPTQKDVVAYVQKYWGISVER